MKGLGKCFLVGVLVPAMTVDCLALGGGLFRRGRCPAACCCNPCPPEPCDVDLCVTSARATCACSGIALENPCPSSKATRVAAECSSCSAATSLQVVAEATSSVAVDDVSEIAASEMSEMLAPPTPVERPQPREVSAPEISASEIFDTQIKSAEDNSDPDETTKAPSQTVQPPLEKPAELAPLAPQQLTVPTTSSTTETRPAPELEQPSAPNLVGDRYSNTASTPPAPTESEPAPTSEAIDPFDEPEPTSDTLPQTAPETPIEQPASEEEDLFGPDDTEVVLIGRDKENKEGSVETPQTTKSFLPTPLRQEIELPTLEETATPVETEEVPFDPFGDGEFSLETKPSTLNVVGGLQSATFRTWTDNSGRHQCQARLVHVTAKHVTLRQASGTKLVVPLARLASRDLHFVHQQVVALRVARNCQTAAEKLAVAW